MCHVTPLERFRGSFLMTVLSPLTCDKSNVGYRALYAKTTVKIGASNYTEVFFNSRRE